VEVNRIGFPYIRCATMNDWYTWMEAGAKNLIGRYTLIEAYRGDVGSKLMTCNPASASLPRADYFRSLFHPVKN